MSGSGDVTGRGRCSRLYLARDYAVSAVGVSHCHAVVEAGKGGNDASANQRVFNHKFEAKTPVVYALHVDTAGDAAADVVTVECQCDGAG